MEQKIRIGVLIKSRTTLWANSREEKLPAALAYKIVKFCKATEADEEFYTKQVRDIVTEYAEKDEKGDCIIAENGSIRLKKECVYDANAALKKLDELEVDKPKFSFTLSELDGLKMTASEMLALDEFIREEE